MAAPAVPRNVIGQLRRYLADVDPQRVTSARAVELVQAGVEIERLGVAMKTLFADRAACFNTWSEQGHDSAGSWLAELTKTPVSDANSTLEASRALCELPGTTEAVKDGALSAAQVHELTRTAKKDPAAERELLQVAQRKSLKHLRDRARQIRGAASSKEEEAARYRQILRRRHCRTWTDDEGAFRLDARLTIDSGARLLASLEAEANAIFCEARASGVREHPDAHRADALVALGTGTARTGAGGESPAGSRPGARTDVVVIRVDAEALQRGHTEAGEISEIEGLGPVPVELVRRKLPTSFVKSVFHDAVDVKSVCHHGRAVTAHMMTALEERDRSCVWPGCSVSRGLEAHHWRQDFAMSGVTSVDELARLCQWHHDRITYGGYVLEGGPGAWRYRAPPAPPISEHEDFLDTG